MMTRINNALFWASLAGSMAYLLWQQAYGVIFTVLVFAVAFTLFLSRARP